MAYTYSEPLRVQQSIGVVNFATPTAAVLHPVRLQVQKRDLELANFIGILGHVTTAGTGLIQIGDGTTVARYGSFTLTPGLAVNAAVTGTLVLTDDGQHVGASNTAPKAPINIVLTFSGTAALADTVLLFDHFN